MLSSPSQFFCLLHNYILVLIVNPIYPQLAIERRASAVLRGRVDAERARAAELEEGLRRLVLELESDKGPTLEVMQACFNPRLAHTLSCTT
jgi:hypothetical protein